jgi:hypothetical protein
MRLGIGVGLIIGSITLAIRDQLPVNLQVIVWLAVPWLAVLVTGIVFQLFRIKLRGRESGNSTDKRPRPSG